MRNGWCRFTHALDAEQTLRRAAGRPNTGLAILAYHRVLEGTDWDTSWFDEALVSASADEFRAQMRSIRERFELLTFAALEERLAQPARTGRPAAIVTFDDGYRDSYEVVYPILREMRIPATVFVATGFVETGEVYWWDKLVYLVNHATRSSMLLPTRPPLSLSLRTHADRARSARRLLALLKRIPDEDRRRILEVLPVLTGATLDPEVARRLTLRWGEIEAMSRDGIEIASHTVTHPVLSRIPAELLQYEIGTSKDALEEHIGRPVTAFCYPVGGKHSFNESVKAIVQRNGYRFAVCYEWGVNAFPPADRLALLRVRMERSDLAGRASRDMALAERITI